LVNADPDNSKPRGIVATAVISLLWWGMWPLTCFLAEDDWLVMLYG
jgi:hypothetical protein